MGTHDRLDPGRQFASDATDVLNGTITTGVPLSAVMGHEFGKFVIAHQVSRPSVRTPLSSCRFGSGRGSPDECLMTAFKAQLDPEANELPQRPGPPDTNQPLA